MSGGSRSGRRWCWRGKSKLLDIRTGGRGEVQELHCRAFVIYIRETIPVMEGMNHQSYASNSLVWPPARQRGAYHWNEQAIDRESWFQVGSHQCNQLSDEPVPPAGRGHRNSASELGSAGPGRLFAASAAGGYGNETCAIHTAVTVVTWARHWWWLAVTPATVWRVRGRFEFGVGSRNRGLERRQGSPTPRARTTGQMFRNIDSFFPSSFLFI